jgi:hypothetical protein
MWPEALIPGTIYSSILFTGIRGLSTFFSNGVPLSLEIFGIFTFFYFRDHSGIISVISNWLEKIRTFWGSDCPVCTYIK